MRGDVVGGWHVGEPLGLGAHTSVRAASRDGDGAAGAFKRLHRSDPSAAAREAAALRRVDHPGVARLLDAGVDATGSWIVTERVQGPSLLALRRPPGLPAEAVLALGARLADALAACHAVGVFHGDVKPANVRLGPEGRPVLVDLGSASFAEESLGDQGGITPAYAAPEWFDGGPRDRAALDAWALGVTLFELYRGGPAFPRPRLDELAGAVRGWRPVVPGDGAAAAALREGLDALCAPSPAARPSLRALADAWAGWPLVPMAADETVADAGPPSPAAASDVGRYRVLEVAGRGGMGVVFKAWDPALARPVALKRVTVSGAEARARFDREAQAIARVDHPHVVRVLDVGADAQGPWMVQEWVDGGTLHDRLARASDADTTLRPARDDADTGAVLELAEALRLASAVGSALAAAHRAGVVHRDVKPANILLDPSGAPRLADFGVAAVADATGLTRASQAVGTPAWMAPEQAWGGAGDARVDVWGLGALLLTLLTGRPPYGACPAANRFPAHLPASVIRLVRRALEPDPADRWPDMDTFVRAVDATAAALPNSRPAGPVWRWFASTRASHVALVGGALAVGAGVAAPWWWAVSRENAAAEALAGAVALAEDPSASVAVVEQAFGVLRDLPAMVETQARSDAWAALARFREGRGDAHGARLARAQAWVDARTEQQRGLAITALGEDLARAQSWEGLDRLLRAATDERSAVGADLRAAASRARREEPGLAPFTAWWSGARPRPFPHANVVAIDLDGDGREELVGRADGGLVARPGGRWIDGEDTPVEGLQGDFVDATLVPWPGGRAAALLDLRQHGVTELRVPDGAGGWDLALRFPFHRTLGAAAVDLGDDGRVDVIVATGQPSRDLLALRQVADGQWVVEHAHAGTSSLNSDLYGPVVLPGASGSQDVVVAASTWGGFDLRRLRPEADGLSLVRRAPFGTSSGVVAFRGPLGPEIAVLAPGPVRLDHRFPPDAPGGAVAGVHRLDTDLRAPGLVLRHPGVASVAAADVDVDGVDELVLGTVTDTVLVAWTAAGAPRTETLRGLVPVAVGQADDDPPPELLARDAAGALWVLGAPGVRLLALAAPPPVRPPPASLSGPLRDVWARAELLLALGLPRLAEEQLAAIGRLTTGAASGEAFLRAADAAMAEARRDDAVRWMSEARAQPATAIRAARALAAHRAVDHRWAEAAAAWAEAGSPEPTTAGERLAAAAADLVDTPTEHLDLRQPLHPGWSFPVAPPRARSSAGLPLTSNSDDLLVALPLQRTGDVIGVDAELIVERLEWGATLQFALVPEGDQPALGVTFDARGGAGHLQHRVEAVAEHGYLGGAAEDVQRTDHARRTRFRLAITGLERARVFETTGFDMPKVQTALTDGVTSPLADRWRLEVRGTGGWRQGNGLALATLERLTLTGLSVAPPQAAPGGDHAAADGDFARALRDDADGPPTPWRRLVAAAGLGDEAGVRAALGDMPPGPAASSALMRLARTADAATVEALRQHLGDAWPSLFLDAWAAASQADVPDASTLAAWGDALGSVSPGAPEAASVEATRARMLRLLGRSQQALLAARRAVALAGPGGPVSGSAFTAAASARWEEALLLADADPEAAKAAARAAWAASPAPEVLADLMTYLPGFAALRVDPDFADEVARVRLAGGAP